MTFGFRDRVLEAHLFGKEQPMTETNDMTDFETLETKANEAAREAERLKRELELARVMRVADMRQQANDCEAQAVALRAQADEIDPPKPKRGRCKPMTNPSGTQRKPMQGPSQAEVVERVAGYPAFTADAIARSGGWDVKIVKRRLSAAAKYGLVENRGGKGDAAQWYAYVKDEPAVGEAQDG